MTLPFRYVYSSKADLFSGFAQLAIYFATDVVSSARPTILESLPLPIRYEEPVWGSRFLFVCSQEYPGVAVRLGYSPLVRETAAREGWSLHTEDLFDKIAQDYDDEPEEEEVQAFLGDVDTYLRELHLKHPIDLVMVGGALNLPMYQQAHQDALADLCPLMARLTEVENEKISNPHLLDNLAFGLFMTVMDEAMGMSRAAMCAFATRKAKTTPKHWSEVAAELSD